MTLLKGYPDLQGFCEDYNANALINPLELPESGGPSCPEVDCLRQIFWFLGQNQWISLNFFNLINLFLVTLALQVAQRVKHLPAMWETLVQSLGREDTLEKEMATHFSTLAWRIPGIEEPGGLTYMGSHRVGHEWSNLAAAVAAEWLWGMIKGWRR